LLEAILTQKPAALPAAPGGEADASALVSAGVHRHPAARRAKMIFSIFRLCQKQIRLKSVNRPHGARKGRPD